jgi:hypothetical protein
MLTVSQARPTPRASPSAYGSSLPARSPRRAPAGAIVTGPGPQGLARLQRTVYAL